MTSSKEMSRSTSFFWVIFAYLIALGLGCLAALPFYGSEELWIVIGIADLIATVVIFIFSYIFRNSSFYDPYWSVIPIIIAGFLAVEGWNSGADHIRVIVMLLLVLFWGVRLTFNWARGWPGIHHQDWRYDDLSDKTGKWYWLVSFSGIHLFPTVLVFLGCLSLIPAMTMEGPGFGALDMVATLITLGAIIIELVADEQLRHFVVTNKEKGKTLTTGLWAYSRHPNYFGETTFWWGLFLFVLFAYPDYWWMIVGPVSMTILFGFISIPMIEKRSLARRKNYEEVIARVPRWVPWFPKK